MTSSAASSSLTACSTADEGPAALTAEAVAPTLAALDASDPEQVALGNLGAALYAQDEGAAEPAALRHQRSALRDQLDVKSLHAL